MDVRYVAVDDLVVINVEVLVEVDVVVVVIWRSETKLSAMGVPHPVTGSQPTVARYPFPFMLLLPEVTS